MFTASSFKDTDVKNILDNTWHDFNEDDLVGLLKLIKKFLL